MASFAMILMGWVEIFLGVGILFLTEFTLLEVFTDDTEKRSLFEVRYKIIDCLYLFR